jgi:anaerobic magnesium-protoporphyrin IX monomethyl ester cyclase
LGRTVQEFKPDFVGITATTPLIFKAYKIASTVKTLNSKIMVVVGGPHASALPEAVLRESQIDCVVKGEGDYTFNTIVENGLSASIPNIYYKDNGEIIQADIQNAFIHDLDSLPFPAYELFDIQSYRQPKISSRREPLGYLETSRGCYGRCIYCNKNIHGTKVRMKSPKRVVDEIERMLRLGFREINIIDDIFTANMKRAYQICEEILMRGLKFPWYPRGGIRVDRVNLELLQIMKRAGCYRIPFGIESGSQRILDLTKKKITLEQAEEAVNLAKKAGLETECYFMLGLPTETEEDIKKSIEFAIKLDPDYAKFAITIPLPGTPMFESMSAKGQIKTNDWEKFNFSLPAHGLYEHDVLSWDTIEFYYHSSHRKFYLRPGYILKMVYKTIQNGTFWEHFKAFVKTRW